MLRSVKVSLLAQGTQDRGWRVEGPGGVALHTGRAGPREWQLVERHVRHLLGQPTPGERLANALDGILEQYGPEHPAGAAAKAALVECGME